MACVQAGQPEEGPGEQEAAAGARSGSHPPEFYTAGRGMPSVHLSLAISQAVQKAITVQSALSKVSNFRRWACEVRRVNLLCL